MVTRLPLEEVFCGSYPDRLQQVVGVQVQQLLLSHSFICANRQRGLTPTVTVKGFRQRSWTM